MSCGSLGGGSLGGGSLGEGRRRKLTRLCYYHFLIQRLVGVGLLRVDRLQKVPDGRMSVAHHRRELAVPRLHVVVGFIEGAGGAVDQVPGSRRERAGLEVRAVVTPWIQVVWKYERKSSRSRLEGMSSRTHQQACRPSTCRW